MMRKFMIALTALFMAGCTGQPIHQGNRLDMNSAASIQNGDSRYRIEQKLGSPVLKDILHTNRATYYEEYQDKVGDDLHKRRVEVIYGDGGRAISINRFGMDSTEAKAN